MMYDKLATCFFIVINIIIFSYVSYLPAANEELELINNEIYNIPEAFTESATSSNTLNVTASATKTSATQALKQGTVQPNAEISYADIPPEPSENMPPAYTAIVQNYPLQNSYAYFYPPNERMNYIINSPNDRNILLARQRNNKLCFAAAILMISGVVMLFVLTIFFYANH